MGLITQLANRLYPNRVVISAASKLSSVATNSTISNYESEPDKLYKIVELELRGNEPAVLKSFSKFATTVGHHFGLETKSWNLKRPNKDRYTVLKSVHIYKKHMVQYEVRTYFTFVQYKRLTGSTADTLLEYVERNLPEGVALKATKVELQTLPEHLKPEVESEVRSNELSK